MTNNMKTSTQSRRSPIAALLNGFAAIALTTVTLAAVTPAADLAVVGQTLRS